MPAVPGAVVMRYLMDNGISGPEGLYISVLLTWDDVSLLVTLADWLDDFILDYTRQEDGDAGAGYVNQDR